MIAQRELVREGFGITKALDYSLKSWAALSRYLDDGAMTIDNNHIENQTRPWALGRKNWLLPDRYAAANERSRCRRYSSDT
jgi:transposase